MAIRRVPGRRAKHPSGKRLFPVQLAEHEKTLLTFLSTDSGQAMGAVIRRLIFQEASLRVMQRKVMQELKVTQEPKSE